MKFTVELMHCFPRRAFFLRITAITKHISNLDKVYVYQYLISYVLLDFVQSESNQQLR